MSGKYKKQGYGKALLQKVIAYAQANGKNGLVTVVGTKKFHFMSDTKWFLKQGFEELERFPNGFSLIAKKIHSNADKPYFKQSVLSGECVNKEGLTVYYSNRCPFSDYHVNESLVDTAKKRKISLQIIKLASREEAQIAPTPATIFSLFYQGEFITTDISVCMDSRYDKLMKDFID